MTPIACDVVWNRARYGGGNNPRAGDSALAALLRFHGAAMNGGVLHAVECLGVDEFTAAEAGYRYFGFPEVAQLLLKAQRIFNTEQDLGEYERPLDGEYASHIPTDSVLVKRLQERFSSNPSDFSPVH